MARKENTERIYKVMFTKSGNGNYTARINLPYSLLKDLGINPGDSVKLSPGHECVIIRRA